MARSKGSWRTTAHPEDQLQRQIVRYLELQKPPCIWFAVPNGGKRGRIEAARLKGLGVKAGVADLCFVWTLPEPHPLVTAQLEAAFVEVKTETGRLSKAQVAFSELCQEHDIPYEVIRSVEEMRALLKDWGLLPGGA